MTRQAAQETVNTVVTDAHGIKLSGLGTRFLKERAVRIGRNPVSGERLEIPVKRTVQFKMTSDRRSGCRNDLARQNDTLILK
jgi:DNA-binding protein HU-beta